MTYYYYNNKLLPFMLQIKMQSGLRRTHFPLLLLILLFLYNGLQTQAPDASYFSPAKGSDFLASSSSCCVGGLRLPSGSVMWLRLSGLLRTSGRHFPLTHLLIPAEVQSDCTLHKGLRGLVLRSQFCIFFQSYKVFWMYTLDEVVSRQSLQITVCLLP